MNASKSEAPLGSGPLTSSNGSDSSHADSCGIETKIASRFESHIKRLAWHYARGNHQLQQDLAQEGLIGLVNAHRNFKLGGGASFATYADRHIRGRMKNFVRSESRHNCCVSWAEYHGTETDTDDAADESPKVMSHEAIDAIGQFLFSVEVQLLRQFLNSATDTFTPKQQLVFRLRFLHGLTVGEIAQSTRVSPARVSQVLAEAVVRLQASFIRN
jgi:RNA polymerase sigma factor (sigma-70 family)